MHPNPRELDGTLRSSPMQSHQFAHVIETVTYAYIRANRTHAAQTLANYTKIHFMQPHNTVAVLLYTITIHTNTYWTRVLKLSLIRKEKKLNTRKHRMPDPVEPPLPLRRVP